MKRPEPANPISDSPKSEGEGTEKSGLVALFRARDDALRAKLIAELNREREAAGGDKELAELALAFLHAPSGYAADPVFGHGIQIGPDSTPAQIKMAALELMISPSLRHLQGLSVQGHTPAMKALAQVAIRATETLGIVRKKHSKKLAEIASREIAWPVLKSECLYFDQTGKPPSNADRELFHQLKVGKHHPIKGQRWNPAGDPRSIALTAIMGKIQSARFPNVLLSFADPPLDMPPHRRAARQLRDLSPKQKVIDEWWCVIKQWLADTHPTNDKLVKAYAHFCPPKSKRSLGERATWIRGQLKLRLGWMAGLKPRQSSRQVAGQPHKTKSPANDTSEHFDPDAFAREQKQKGNLI